MSWLWNAADVFLSSSCWYLRLHLMFQWHSPLTCFLYLSSLLPPCVPISLSIPQLHVFLMVVDPANYLFSIHSFLFFTSGFLILMGANHTTGKCTHFSKFFWEQFWAMRGNKKSSNVHFWKNYCFLDGKGHLPFLFIIFLAMIAKHGHQMPQGRHASLWPWGWKAKPRKLRKTKPDRSYVLYLSLDLYSSGLLVMS